MIYLSEFLFERCPGQFLWRVSLSVGLVLRKFYKRNFPGKCLYSVEIPEKWYPHCHFIKVLWCRKTLPWVSNRSEEKSYWEFTVMILSSFIKTIRIDGSLSDGSLILYFSSLLTGGSAYFVKFIIYDRKSFLTPECWMMLEASP